MKNFRRISILLIILIIVCGVVLLTGEANNIQARNNLPGINDDFASVAWLEVCSILEADFEPTANLTRTYISF